MAQQGVNLPSGMGGLMRYNEEYKSSIKLNPAHVVILIILIITLVVSLKYFYPIIV